MPTEILAVFATFIILSGLITEISVLDVNENCYNLQPPPTFLN